MVNKVAPNYKAFGPVLSDIVRDRVRGMFGAAGVKLGQITKRVTDTWQLGEGWTSHVVARSCSKPVRGPALVAVILPR